ncbi:unnamed protein product [Rotaria magnacalcarata]|uniref:Uncharacterized protein n=1 Tax=Rotaria magnacalcarata TaxID=392030 RepID=A0A816ZJU5_9BILA|nr:unnamed protein product [Rotaria magnacalcarata]
MRRFFTYLGLAKVEQKLTDVQLQYLRQCKHIHSSRYAIVFFLDYTVNPFSNVTEVREIGKQWNSDSFDFNVNLRKWFSGRRMADQEIVQRPR